MLCPKILKKLVGTVVKKKKDRQMPCINQRKKNLLGSFLKFSGGNVFIYLFIYNRVIKNNLFTFDNQFNNY